MESPELREILGKINFSIIHGFTPPVAAMMEAILTQDNSKLEAELRRIDERCNHPNYAKSVEEDRQDGFTLTEVVVRVCGLEGLGFSSKTGWYIEDGGEDYPLTPAQEIRLYYALTKVSPIYNS